MTTNLRPGYVRKNGAPYSQRAIVTEYYRCAYAANGDQWITVTTKVEDPDVFHRPSPHDLGFQEASRRDRVESDALLRALRF